MVERTDQTAMGGSSTVVCCAAEDSPITSLSILVHNGYDVYLEVDAVLPSHGLAARANSLETFQALLNRWRCVLAPVLELRLDELAHKI